MSFLLSLLAKPKLIGYGFAFLAVFSLGWYVHSRIAESTLKSALASQQDALVKQCDKDKALTSEVSREYEDKITALNRRVAALRLRPAKCVPIITSPTGKRDGGSGGGINAGAHGIGSEWALDYGAEAEKYRLQLISCQEFVRKERLK